MIKHARLDDIICYQASLMLKFKWEWSKDYIESSQKTFALLPQVWLVPYCIIVHRASEIETYIYICKLEINKIYVFYKIIFALFLVPQLHSYKHDQVLYPHQVPQSVLFIKPYMKSWEIFRFLSFFSTGQVNNALNLINEWMNHAWSCTLLQLMSLF